MGNNLYVKVGRMFARVNRLHHAECEKKVSELRIHRGQHFILMMLANENCARAQKDIAEKLQISTAAVAVMLKKLQADGYIKKSEDKADSRIKIVEITEKGRETVNRSREFFESIDKDMLRGLSDNEIDEFYKILCIMEKNLLDRRNSN